MDVFGPLKTREKGVTTGKINTFGSFLMGAVCPRQGQTGDKIKSLFFTVQHLAKPRNNRVSEIVRIV